MAAPGRGQASRPSRGGVALATRALACLQGASWMNLLNGTIAVAQTGLKRGQRTIGVLGK